MREGEPLPATAGAGSSRAALLPRVLAFARREDTRGLFGVAVLKASIIALNFTLIALAARVLGTEGFGTYSILFSAAGLVSIVATFGQQMLVMRSWSEYSAPGAAGLLKGSLLYSGAICLFGAVLAGLGLAAWKGLAGGGSALAAAAGAYGALLALVMTSSHLVRSAFGVARGDGHANLTAAGPPAALLAVCLALGIVPPVAAVFACFAAGLLAALLVHVVSMRAVLARRPGFATAAPRRDLAAWNPRSLKLWLSSALEASNQYLDVLLVGYLLSPAAAGAYFVTTRLANAFATASDAVNMFSTRHIPDLHYRGERRALGALLDSVATLTALMIAGGLALLLGAGPLLLSVFNPDYAAYFPALAVLCLGTAAIAAVGPAPSALMLTGHEGRYLAILAVSIAVRAAGFVALVPSFGVLGAAAATTLSFVLMAVQLQRSSLHLSGFDPSVLRLLRRRTGER